MVFELVEGSHNRIGLLAYAYKVYEGIKLRSLCLAAPRHALRKKTCHKQGVIPNMFAYCAFSVEGACLKQRVGFDEHFPHVLETLSKRIPNAKEIIDVDEIGQQV